MELTTILWMFMLGAIVATVSMYYNNKFLGGVVRALIKIDATSPETALTLEELNIKLSPALKHALRPGTSFSQTVLKTEDGRYYIAPDKLSMAKSKYSNKDMSIVFVLLSVLILVLAGFAATYIFPDVIESFSQQMTSIFG